MNSNVALSSTSQRLIMIVSTPAFLKARCRPYTPSLEISPSAVWHADSTSNDVPERSNPAMSSAWRRPSSIPSGICSPFQALPPFYKIRPDLVKADTDEENLFSGLSAIVELSAGAKRK